VVDSGALSLVAVGALGATYSYCLYPLLLLLLRDASTRRSGAARRLPTLTLIIAARNEEARIRAKIEESLVLRQACPDLEILVASDASTDATDDIVRSFEGRRVHLVRTAEHHGKEAAQQAAIAVARGDVIVFTDTGTTIECASIIRIVELFDDATIGAVSSTDRFIDKHGAVSGEGMYIRYEMWLRSLESRKGGLVGLSGSFFAARREVCRHWDTDVPSDFAVAINGKLLGLRAVSDRGVIGLYRDAQDPAHEFARKVRTVIRGMSTLWKKREALSFVKYGQFAFQLWSHKVMRYAAPWFALAYALGALLIAPRAPRLGAALLTPVVLLLAASAVGKWWPSARRRSAISAAYYFVQVNVAVMLAGIQFLRGKRVRTWVPTRR
jgi:glycosyltransferase involved in cell wall biosynthesis